MPRKIVDRAGTFSAGPALSFFELPSTTYATWYCVLLNVIGKLSCVEKGKYGLMSRFPNELASYARASSFSEANL